MEAVSTGIMKSGDITEPVNMKTEAPGWHANTTPPLPPCNSASGLSWKRKVWCWWTPEWSSEEWFWVQALHPNKERGDVYGREPREKDDNRPMAGGPNDLGTLYGIFLSMSDFA